MWTPPTVTDNSGMVTLTSSHNTSDSFPIGTTIVNYTAVDGAGNMADVCSFNVTITGRVKHLICLLQVVLARMFCNIVPLIFLHADLSGHDQLFVAYVLNEKLQLEIF